MRPIVYALIWGMPMSSPKITRMLGVFPLEAAGCCWAFALVTVAPEAISEAAASVVPPSKRDRRLTSGEMELLSDRWGILGRLVTICIASSVLENRRLGQYRLP